MKKYSIFAAVLVAGIAMSYALFFQGGASALHVNQVASDPSAYNGTIQVTGIVAGTSPQDPSLFGIFDIKELKCKTPNCNKLYLPVRHQGTVPKPGDEVLVSGSFEKTNDGYIFSATNVKVKRNHRIRG